MTDCALSICDGSGLIAYDTDTTACPCRGGRHLGYMPGQDPTPENWLTDEFKRARERSAQVQEAKRAAQQAIRGARQEQP